MSPALSQISVASWSAVDNVYQQNLADATAAILEVLNNSYNTWNFPSPSANTFRSPLPIVPAARLPSPVLDNPAFFPPVFIPAEPQPLVLTPPASPDYVITSAPVSPAPVTNLNLLAHVAAYKDDYRLDNQENLLPAPTQDSFVHKHLGYDP